ncbi:MFS transporter [Geothrix sp. PMB-07]|uniref:MFS transporter n=1 Tax=Geothrix sp. PMB-07 TaxID=3068640 RepID=UPI0027423EE0|nr:MFS transporter [Geothrix sp. PMB-07]WLT32246.1 MFS transporter [Geothrix sp. PMB-07]
MATDAGGPPHDPYAVLRNPDYRWFIASMGLVTLGLQMQGLVVGWQVYVRTGDPLALGLVGLSEALPFIGVALFGGHVADRVNRLRLCMGSTLALAFCSALLLGFTWHFTTGAAAKAVVPIYGIIFLTGIVRAFYRPANLALGTDLLPKELYANGSTWRVSVFHSGMVLGPALGGLVYAWRGPVAAHALVLALLVTGFLGLLPIHYLPRAIRPQEGSIFASLGEGLRFVFSQKLLLGAISLDLFAVLFGGAVAVLPVFAKEVLMTGPHGLGALRAAPAVGSVLMGLTMAHLPPLRKAGRTLLFCVAGFGLAMIGFALSRSFVASLLLLAASGAMDNVSVVLRATLLQTLTPEHMLGRVSSVNQVFIGSSNEIGAFESGLAARLLGLVPSVVFGGCMTLLVVLFTSWRVPELRKMERIG